MNSFYKLIASIIKEADEAFSGHATFRVADPKAVGENPIREYSLDAVPLDSDQVMVTLSMDGGEKAFEKTLSSDEAKHIFTLISSDLAEAVSLTAEQKYDAAKESIKKVLKNYAESTDTPVETNLPKLHNTQADMDPERAYEVAMDGLDRKLMKGLIHQEEYDAAVEALNNKLFPNEKSLYRQAKITMQNLWFSNTDELLEYQQKQKGAQSTQDHIPLWDAEKDKAKAPVKDTLSAPSMSYEDVEKEKEKKHEDMTKHIDEKIKTELESALQQKAASVFGPADIELVKSLRAPGIGRNWDEIKKIFIKDLNRDKDATTIFLDEQRQALDPAGIDIEPVKEDVNIDVKEKAPLTPPEELVSPETHDQLLKDHEDKKKDNSPVKEKSDTFTPKDVMNISEDEEIKDESSLNNEIARADNDDIHKVASLKTAAPSDLNPLQEPLKEQTTTPSQDTIPMNKSVGHDVPQHGDRVFVTTDLANEKSGYEGTYVSDYMSKGTKFFTIETDEGDLRNVESHRVVKISEGSSGAQDVEPVMEPQIEMPKDEEIQVTPKMDDFHASSQKEFLTIKAEAEALLQEIDGMGKTSYKFIKKGLEKHASDSAFEGNGWCRVWVTDDEVAADAKYAETLKLPDETARIEALKEIARNIAHEALRLADDSGAKVGVQSWFDSLSPSDHDRIDWVALANPKSSEDEDLEFEREQGRKYGPDAVLPEFRDQVNPKSSLEPKVEKTAYDPKWLEKIDCEDCRAVSSGHDRKHYCEKHQPKEAAKKTAADGSACIKCHKVFPLDQMVGNEHGAGYLCKEHASEWNKDASLKVKADDFEKGISQDKTADEPEVAPKTQFKELKKAPAYTDREQAVPASPELDQVLSKLDILEQNLNTLDTAKKQIQAKMKEEIAKLEQRGERVQLEQELQESINKAGILIDALENKVVSWRDKIYTMQTQEVSYVPNITPKEMLEKLYQKFSGAQQYVESVLNGMKSQAVNVLEKTLVRFPGKKSSLDKKASVIDIWNDELMAALKELSTPL